MARIVAEYSVLFLKAIAVFALTSTELPSRQFAELRSLLVAGAGSEAVVYLVFPKDYRHLSVRTDVPATEGIPAMDIAPAAQNHIARHPSRNPAI